MSVRDLVAGLILLTACSAGQTSGLGTGGSGDAGSGGAGATNCPSGDLSAPLAGPCSPEGSACSISTTEPCPGSASATHHQYDCTCTSGAWRCEQTGGDLSICLPDGGG